MPKLNHDTAQEQLGKGYNLPAERDVLGIALYDPATVPHLADLLDPGDFYDPSHAAIWSAILDARKNKTPITVTAIGTKLMHTGDLKLAGGVAYLTDMLRDAPPPVQASYHADLVEEAARVRRTIREATRLTAAGDDITADRLAELAASVVKAAQPRTVTSDMVTIGAALPAVLTEIEDRLTREAGIETGFVDLDALIPGGLRPGTVTIVAGTPGTGKTVFATDIARHNAIRRGKQVAYFSFEITLQDLIERMLSAETKIPYANIRASNLSDNDWTTITNAVPSLDGKGIHIYAEGALPVAGIVDRCERTRDKHGLDLVVIDYMQKVVPARASKDRQIEVAEISNDIQQHIAKGLDVPVISIASLNREGSKRANHAPVLTDLRESGRIESDADIVMMLHRDDREDTESPRAGEADVYLRKNRGGTEQCVTLAAQLHLQRFASMAVD